MFLEHIRMIFEGSYDTDDWSNDVENSGLPSQKYIAFESILKSETIVILR